MKYFLLLILLLSGCSQEPVLPCKRIIKYGDDIYQDCLVDETPDKVKICDKNLIEIIGPVFYFEDSCKWFDKSKIIYGEGSFLDPKKEIIYGQCSIFKIDKAGLEEKRVQEIQTQLKFEKEMRSNPDLKCTEKGPLCCVNTKVHFQESCK